LHEIPSSGYTEFPEVAVWRINVSFCCLGGFRSWAENFRRPIRKFLQAMAKIPAYSIYHRGIESQGECMKASLDHRVEEGTPTLVKHQ
jgi:hypothetical protein